MIIRYANGKMIEAVLLSRAGDTLRAAARGSEDLMELTRVNGSWITDDCEAVQVVFEWERQGNPNPNAISLEDCLCTPELAARLINLLDTTSEEDAPEVAPVNDLSVASDAHPLV